MKATRALGWVLRLCIIAVALALLSGCSSDSDSAGKEDAAVSSQERPVTVEGILGFLKDQGLPIGETEIYTAEDDPNELLGRPGQYIGKAAWHDTRMELERLEGTIDWAASGGTIEVFENEAQARARKEYVEDVIRDIPMLTEYIYQQRRVILRIGKSLVPAQAQEYEAALREFGG